MPLIYIRERLSLESQRTVREVIDGQQRLRTLFGFIDPGCLEDFDEERDSFTVRAAHNADIGRKPFADIGQSWQRRILGYKLSVVTLPSDVEDQEILQIFARLNSTGQTLSAQELRNARYFGEFKSLMYEIAYGELDRWREWGIFTGDEISRMKEVEFVSDLVLSMENGISGKSKPALDRLYRDNDETYAQGREISRRFHSVMDVIDREFGNFIEDTVFVQQMHFFSLFLYIYDRMWGIGSKARRSKAKTIPAGTSDRLLRLHRRFERQKVPKPSLIQLHARQQIRAAVMSGSTIPPASWMEMSSTRAIEDLEARARRIRRFIRDVEDAYDNGLMGLGAVEVGYCGALLNWTTAVERSLERLFFGYMTGRYLLNGRNVSKVSIGSNAVAQNVIRNGRAYVDWLPFDRTESRARIYLLSGRPFTSLDGLTRKSLDELQILRNLVAHDSHHARKRFAQVCLESRAIRDSERRAGGFLRRRCKMMSADWSC